MFHLWKCTNCIQIVHGNVVVVCFCFFVCLFFAVVVFDGETDFFLNNCMIPQ